jgi:CRP-like cAMP-binding protein
MSIYDPAIALEFFRSAGKPAAVAQGETIFTEKQNAIPLFRKNRIFLLLKGEVELLAADKPIAVVRPGEVFGELAVITHAPRSASAMAKTACRVIALDDKTFEAALRAKPAFALMLMSIMIRRLRETIARLAQGKALSRDDAWKEAAAFDPGQLSDLARGLADDPPVSYRAGASILTQGQKGLRMYAVIEGRVAISIEGRVVEKLGPGGVFGEAALINETPRLASAVAEADCSLLPISRKAFFELIKLSPQFADTLLTSLAQRLKFLTARLE